MVEEQKPSSAQDWTDEIRRYQDTFREKFTNRGKKIVARYRDERKDSECGETRYNVLWSNVRTLKPAVFAKIPKPEVCRRWKDKNPVARTAATLLERALTFEVNQYSDYKSALSNCVDDRLLPGRGVAWVRYEPITEQVEQSPGITEDIEVGQDSEYSEPMEQITNELTPVDYVYWEDFAHDAAARTWEEVTWVARRVYLKKDEGLKRFGDAFTNVPLVNRPEGEKGQIATAEVWEIWCKSSKALYWIATGYDEILDERPDPLELESFFPCPKPLYATITTESLIPVPDYALYQDQAKELDEVSERIRVLTKSLKAAGVYAADEPALTRLLKEGNDGDMIPVTNWPAFAEKGGLSGAFQLLPLKEVVATLQELYRNREACKQAIYEITGLSDIVRGASVASETATAQQIKSQFASIRLNDMKNDVARFACDLIRMKAEIMCSKYQPQTLVAMSGMMNTPDAQYLEQAIMMLKDEPLRNFSIEIEADSLIELDQQQEKADRIEFLGSVGSFMREAAQAPEELKPLLAELLLFTIRGFKVGASIEGSFENYIDSEQERQQQMQQQPPQPSPEQLQMQAQQQADQMKAQSEQFKMQLEQAKIQQDEQFRQMELQLEQSKLERDEALERWRAELDANTKIYIAQLNHNAQKEQQERTIAIENERAEREAMTREAEKPDIDGLANTINQQMQRFFESMIETNNRSTQQIINTVTRPKKLIRDPITNKIMGVE